MIPWLELYLSETAIVRDRHARKPRFLGVLFKTNRISRFSNPAGFEPGQSLILWAGTSWRGIMWLSNARNKRCSGKTIVRVYRQWIWRKSTFRWVWANGGTDGVSWSGCPFSSIRKMPETIHEIIIVIWALCNYVVTFVIVRFEYLPCRRTLSIWICSTTNTS